MVLPQPLRSTKLVSELTGRGGRPKCDGTRNNYETVDVYYGHFSRSQAVSRRAGANCCDVNHYNALESRVVCRMSLSRAVQSAAESDND